VILVHFVAGWNILNHRQVKTIAVEVPMTMDELATCGLPENVLQTYGERLLKNVNAYNESNNLQSDSGDESGDDGST
jgi:hypothetical protein